MPEMQSPNLNDNELQEENGLGGFPLFFDSCPSRRRTLHLTTLHHIQLVDLRRPLFTKIGDRARLLRHAESSE